MHAGLAVAMRPAPLCYHWRHKKLFDTFQRVSLSSIRNSASGLANLVDGRGTRVLAVMLVAAVIGYIAWKIGQSPPQALQFAFNGLAVGAVYALLALGFTLVYSTVWFFDLYYGAAAALGAYGVFTFALRRRWAAVPTSTAST